MISAAINLFRGARVGFVLAREGALAFAEKRAPVWQGR